MRQWLLPPTHLLIAQGHAMLFTQNAMIHILYLETTSLNLFFPDPMCLKDVKSGRCTKQQGVQNKNQMNKAKTTANLNDSGKPHLPPPPQILLTFYDLCDSEKQVFKFSGPQLSKLQSGKQRKNSCEVQINVQTS